MEPYLPGLHIIATLQSGESPLLCHSQDFRNLADALIDDLNLQKLGEVYHDFPAAGFTGVICLSESHISVHTWPEYNRVNVDIYLSNYLRENDGTVRNIFEQIKTFFKAEVLSEQNLKR